MQRVLAGANRRAAIHAACVVIAALVLLSTWNPEPRPALGMAQSNRAKVPAASTPIAAVGGSGETSSDDPLDGDRSDGDRRQADPLDGDPLDGEPGSNNGAKDDLVRLEITRSGRPEGAPNSVIAYDDDPETTWEPEEESERPWLWLDLGEVHELRQVRWLASGRGTIDISVSRDRQDWEQVESLDVRDLWQETSLRDDARYVRLELTPDDEDELPAISEVRVYGKDDSGASLEQKANSERKGNKNKNKNKNKSNKKDRKKNDKSNKDDTPNESNGNKGNKDKEKGGNSGEGNTSGGSSETRDGISVEAGETHCRGDRNRCRARAGEVDVADDCGDGSTCTIDIRADGGSATCDSTGGDENRAGNGEGKRSGDGGRCEAVANGGTVTMGDINP